MEAGDQASCTPAHLQTPPPEFTRKRLEQMCVHSKFVSSRLGEGLALGGEVQAGAGVPPSAPAHLHLPRLQSPNHTSDAKRNAVPMRKGVQRPAGQRGQRSGEMDTGDRDLLRHRHTAAPRFPLSRASLLSKSRRCLNHSSVRVSPRRNPRA